MRNQQTYCDRCGAFIAMTPDHVQIKNIHLGSASYDLCWACSKELFEQFRGYALSVRANHPNVAD